MKTASVLIATLLACPITAPVQVGPFTSGAAVTLEVQPASPTAGSDFTVAIQVNLGGVTSGSSAPAALGGFVIPVAFDSARVTLKSVAKGSASGFTSDLIYTDIHKANASGCVTVVNAHTGTGTPTGIVHVATLTFTANQGGTVEFNVNSARARWEGSLASAYDPVRAEGPVSIAYTDQATSIRLQQGSAPYRLIYPSFVSTSSGFQGVAIVNESPAPATLTFRAFGADGKLLARTGMANPSAPAVLAAHTQYAKVVEEIFALHDVFGTDHGWIEVESTASNTSGLFLIGHTVNGITTELDGADVSHALTAHAIFPVVGKDTTKETRICVVNPASAPATGSLKLQNGDGTTQQIFPVSIPAQGVFEKTFQSTAVPGDGYVELEMSSGRVTGLERFGNANALACLAAQDVDKASNVLCAPHLASGKAGARYFSEINVVNTNSQAASATFRLLNDEGGEVASPVMRTIGGKSQLRIRADRLFGLPDPVKADGCTTGTILVECDRELVGSITFGGTDGAFLSGLPLLSPSSAKREIYLDHVALGTVGPITYWTGVALVNASHERDAHVAIRLYKADGELVGQITRTIPKKGRLLKLVSELDPSFNVNQFGGFLRVTSDVEVFALVLFGDTGSTLLSLAQHVGTGRSPATAQEDVRRSANFPGDLDGSGRINVADLCVLDLYLAGLVTPRSAPFSAGIPSADMNGDGEVNAADRLLLAAVLAGNELLDPPGVTLALINGTLVDGTGAAPVQDSVLAIGGRGKIVGVGRRGQVDIPAGTNIIDVQGATILPGFINAHVHDAYSAANLEAWARAGVTTVRDEAINQRGVLLKDLILQRDAAWILPRYARLVSAGWMITAPGGYGRLGVSTADEASRCVAEELDAGADLIKLAVEDGIAGRTDLPVLSAAALQAAVAAAHARGKPVSAHVTDARFLQTVVDAGVDDAAHVTWDPVPDAVFRRMIARHISMVPTLTVLEAYGTLAGAQANVRRFVELGGDVALGNDYTDVPQNNFPHFELGMPMHEIERMAESGMTAMQIIVAATKNAAHVCGLDEELGTLEIGKTADVLVVNGDPLRNLSALTDVRLVIHRGTVIRGH